MSQAPGSCRIGTVSAVEDVFAHQVVDPFVDPRRIVGLEAVHNFRDLGGYPAAGGTITRWHLLYRADGLGRLAGADIEVVRALGLRTVIDLRSQAELDGHGRFPHEAIDVTFTHLPIIDATWAADSHLDKTEHEFLVWAYRNMLEVGSARFARAITELAVPGALPAVFHCAAGKDRTGILAALVLGALGVPRTVVLADYALTVDGMQLMRAYAERTHPEMAERMAATPSAFMAALPDALGDVLDHVVAEHGSVRGYLDSIGVSPESIHSLTSQLLIDP